MGELQHAYPGELFAVVSAVLEILSGVAALTLNLSSQTPSYGVTFAQHLLIFFLLSTKTHFRPFCCGGRAARVIRSGQFWGSCIPPPLAWPSIGAKAVHRLAAKCAGMAQFCFPRGSISFPCQLGGHVLLKCFFPTKLFTRRLECDTLRTTRAHRYESIFGELARNSESV